MMSTYKGGCLDKTQLLEGPYHIVKNGFGVTEYNTVNNFYNNQTNDVNTALSFIVPKLSQNILYFHGELLVCTEINGVKKIYASFIYFPIPIATNDAATTEKGMW